MSDRLHKITGITGRGGGFPGLPSDDPFDKTTP
jgi:hypothetical protein